MNKQDVEQLGSILIALCEYYNRDNLSHPAVMMYAEDLQEYSMDQIIAAIKDHRRSPDGGQFYPKISDLIKRLEGGEITEDMIIAAAKNPETPLGCLARIRIGSWDLSSADSFYLRQRAAECKFALGEWREKAKAGSFTDHEISVMLKYNVNPSAPLHNGLAPPMVNMDLIDTAKRIESSPRHLRFIEPSYVHDSREIELTKEMAEVLDQLKNKKGGDDE